MTHQTGPAEDEEAALLKAAEKSSRPWLGAAIVIAVETAMRQSELAGLTWGRVKLDAEYPHVDLPKTKNDRPRRVLHTDVMNGRL